MPVCVVCPSGLPLVSPHNLQIFASVHVAEFQLWLHDSLMPLEYRVGIEVISLELSQAENENKSITIKSGAKDCC